VSGASSALLQRTAAGPPVCLVELLFGVDDVGPVEVSQERIHSM
jgi:hypothetical protein